MDQLHQEYIESLAVIEWHNLDEFEFPEGLVRDDWYGVTGYPTVWFDGWTSVVGGYDPTSYPYYVPVMEERVPYPSNFEIFMEITPTEGTDYNVTAKIDITYGNSTENLAGFVVLTETDLESPGYENQNFVARNVWPDAMGLPIDFSTQTSFTWNTVVTIEDNYLIENCEVVVFIQNMDTKEIYQGTSLLMTDITTGYDPASNLSYELMSSDVVLNWDEPVSEGLTGYNVYHAYETGDFEVLEFVNNTTYTHVDPDLGLHQYYITAVYVTGESEPTNTVELVLTSIGEDISYKFKVYPNPAIDRVNIKSLSIIEYLEVYNHLGQLVYEIAAGSNILNMDVSGLVSGLYYFKILTEEGIVVKQVIIE